MDRLWATWRMPYIERVEEPGDGCIFCDKPAEKKDDENFILFRGAKAFVILNAFPYNPGHVMVAPYRHLGAFGMLDDDERKEAMDLLALSEKVIQELFNPHGINMGVNLGRAAGAGVPGHIHMHLVPRWQGDTNFMPLFADVRVVPQGLVETSSRLRDLFARHGG